MAKPPTDSIIEALLERHGQTYAQELGIDMAKGTPSVLFRLLVASVLFSARIGAGQAVKAARALTEAGWTTAEKLAKRSEVWFALALVSILAVLILPLPAPILSLLLAWYIVWLVPLATRWSSCVTSSGLSGDSPRSTCRTAVMTSRRVASLST